MKKKLFWVLGFVFLVFVIWVIWVVIKSAIAPIVRTTSSKPKVAASIFPIYDMVKNVAGDRLDVVQVLPPGASPHTFEPRPDELRRLSDAKIIFVIGHNLDNWTEQIASVSAGIKITPLDKGISLISDVLEGGENPHYWLTMPNAIQMVEQIKQMLVAEFPDNASTFESNAAAYISQLKDTDKYIRAELSGAKRRDIATFHDAWVYYAKEYDLNVVTSFEEFPGKEPTPTYLHSFMSDIKKYKVKTIFSEPQFSSASIAAIANDLGTNIVAIDPEGSTLAKSYIDMMKSNSDIIANSLK